MNIAYYPYDVPHGGCLVPAKSTSALNQVTYHHVVNHLNFAYNPYDVPVERSLVLALIMSTLTQVTYQHAEAHMNVAYHYYDVPVGSLTCHHVVIQMYIT